MKIKYSELIDQTLYFPTEEFNVSENNLQFHDIPLMDVVEQFGTPLKFNYLPKISANIQRAKAWFKEAFELNDYKKEYRYCYCTKSSHFAFVLEEALKNDISIETSSAYDMDIVKALYEKGKYDKSVEVICNGFKTDDYLAKISDLINDGFHNITPILDNYRELDKLTESIDTTFNIGIRIASEEEPKFEFYTSRLGIGYKDIIPYYSQKIAEHPNARLKMLHFFINTGIKDTAYYWNELYKCLRVYARLKKIAPEVDSLNIGGGFPIKTSLNFDYNYQYMVNEIVSQIKKFCEEEGVEEPNIYTEFGSFTVGESGGHLYKIISQKRQNDREKWNMIDSSFMTTLPDTWAISRHFIMLPLNRWDDTYERVFLGGLTCDSDDYYNSEQHTNAIYLPVFSDTKPLYIGFFHTGAYQETIGGYGGVHHCLMPQPKHILIDKDEEGNFVYTLFREEQRPDDVLKLLGY
ncbi:arginine decarboxylase [Chryseobacterium salipaludis]|uniref:arginine decarboxylase n=1 Tax=Chryseobacterium TaxID=59732 RepID=UPI000E98266F|nr:MULTISPECIES: arginine decarboxylase [Chryseobacterium]MCJ8498735.1 arginine decarboxylase [Chryseobacterium salipaludis]MCX3297613.1 arginine decarboxylase [Planobacterium sp. JC490]HAV02180.1 arginine decarboxylase [Chryseobacterium sp.]